MDNTKRFIELSNEGRVRVVRSAIDGASLFNGTSYSKP